MKLKAILWDIDNTVLDFSAAERASLRRAFQRLSLGECTNEMAARYADINLQHWQKLERKEITKAQVFEGRFRTFLEGEGIAADPLQVNELFETGLAESVVFKAHMPDLLQELQGQYLQYAVTNGRRDVQRTRLTKGGLYELFDGVFISDEVGYEKPDARFFDAVFEAIAPVKREEVVLIGDSLSSDMQGALNAGIARIWYNHYGSENTKGIPVDREITSLSELPAILKSFI